MDIVWKDVPNYEGRYIISNQGELKSHINGKYKTLKGSKNKDGYTQYTLNYKELDLYNVYGGHQLVAMAFLNHTPNGTKGYIVDHIDDNRLNNNLLNLNIISNFENTVKRYVNKKKYGVGYYKGKFKSNVWHNGKTKYLGYFNTEEEAHQKALKYVKDNNLERIITKDKEVNND